MTLYRLGTESVETYVVSKVYESGSREWGWRWKTWCESGLCYANFLVEI